MKVEKKTIPPVPVDPDVEVVVTLTVQEATDLWMIAGSFSGAPGGTVRETLTPLWDKMGRVLDLNFMDYFRLESTDRYKTVPRISVDETVR